MERRRAAGEPEDQSTWRRPRWVTVLLVAAAVLAALALVAVLTGLGGAHGPGRHLGAPSMSAPAQTFALPAP